LKDSKPSVKSKDELRAFLLQKRQHLLSQDTQQKNQKIFELLKAFIQSQKINTVGLFASYRHEPDMWPLMSYLMKSGYRIGLPKVVDYKSSKMVFERISSINSLTENKLGIKEPTSGETLFLDPKGILIVPALAVDRDGHRIGYGKGFYDRYISANTQLQTVAVVFSDFVFDSLLHDKHDQKVQVIVSDQGVIKIT
jgi:5-formyltetrahydrofolate cyclo-ligase